MLVYFRTYYEFMIWLFANNNTLHLGRSFLLGNNDVKIFWSFQMASHPAAYPLLKNWAPMAAVLERRSHPSTRFSRQCHCMKIIERSNRFSWRSANSTAPHCTPCGSACRAPATQAAGWTSGSSSSYALGSGSRRTLKSRASRTRSDVWTESAPDW